MMAMSEKAIYFDLLIVGGGIAGATLAASLADSDLKIAIVETQPLGVVTQRQRAYAMSLLSKRIFQDLGLWAEIAPASGHYRQIQLSDERFAQTVRFSPQDLETDYLGFSGQHQVILEALQRRLGRTENVQWFCPARVVGIDYGAERVMVTLQGENQVSQTVQARLVVGADGPRSSMRQGAGIGTKGWKYWQSCITFVVKHTAPRNDIAFERFWRTGPMGVLPLTGDRCQIVWTNPHAEAQRLKDLPQDEFIEYLQPFVEPLGEVELVGDRQVFPVQLMQSDRYVKPRLALIGDAAHCCHPVGGQGLNLGIRDAAALAQVILEANERGEDIGHLATLKRYERWRKLENLVILSFTDLLNRSFSTDFLPMVGLRRLGLVAMAMLSPLRLFALKLMTGQKGKQPRVFATPR